MQSTLSFTTPWTVTCARLLGVICLLPTGAFAHPSTQTAALMSDAKIVQNLRAEVEKAAASGQFSGAVLLAKDGKVLFEGAGGFANHAFNSQNRVDTRFNLGSMGKTFTAVAILQLAEQGKLSLQDKLVKLVPDYPDRDFASKVTVYQLLTHTSGLGDMFNEKYEATPKEQLRTIEAHLPLFTGQPLQFEPGAKWSYSNAGFIVLGLIIERVSGQRYYDYVREHVFKPAGMSATDNYDIDEDVPNLALGYTSVPGSPPGAPRQTNRFFVQRGASAGGGYSTVEDLLRFAEALRTFQLLDKGHTDLLMTGRVATLHGTEKYAFGMIEDFVNGVRIVGHGGGGPGISSNLDIYPDLGYVVVVLCNVDAGAQAVNVRVRFELTGQSWPREIRLSSTQLSNFAGKYAPSGGPPGMNLPAMQITADQVGLWAENGGSGNKHRFVPLSSVEFFDIDSPNVHIAFTIEKDGQISGLTFTSGLGPPMKSTRMP